MGIFVLDGCRVFLSVIGFNSWGYIFFCVFHLGLLIGLSSHMVIF